LIWFKEGFITYSDLRLLALVVEHHQEGISRLASSPSKEGA
jgi:hypothetical protein